MRHKNKRLQLSRFTSWHKSTIISLVKNLLIYQTIKTTLTRAKAARPLVEKVITLAKSDTLAAKRKVFKIVSDHKLVSVIFKEIGPRFAKSSGGYTRIINLAKRRGDDASLVLFQLTEIKKKEVKKQKKDKEVKAEEVKSAGPIKEKPIEEKKPESAFTAVKEKPPITKKPTKKFLGGLRNIFKKERDSL